MQIERLPDKFTTLETLQPKKYITDSPWEEKLNWFPLFKNSPYYKICQINMISPVQIPY